jgi:hypothetical protein
MPITHGDDERKVASLDFSKLESLRRFCAEMQQYQVASLNYFKYDVGFKHVQAREKISISSSATCVLSLVATDQWKANKADTKKLLQNLISRNESAGLPKDNPFTLAWILEAVAVLEDRSDALDPTFRESVTQKEDVLRELIKKGGGAVSIDSYPQSAYLTQLVVRVLRRRKKLEPEIEILVHQWASRELTRQLALVQAKSKTQDAFAFAYLLMLVTEVTPLSKITPEMASIQRAALQTVFDCQLKDGTWPLSRPLFHYPSFGNAHCYEYEMLTQLLQEVELEDLLLDYLQKLSLAAKALLGSVYRLEKGVWAWASGHHPQLEGPESWTTASVYHFVHQLDRLLAEAVRRELFTYLDQPLPRTVKRDGKSKDDFAPAPEFLDSVVDVPGKTRESLRDFLWDRFVQPLSKKADSLVEGGNLGRTTPRSAIFFGPPGTSKTELSRKVADFLGWPLLIVDPSLLLRKGMDGIQAEANVLFRMLLETERIVVLFDEFDELVRERGTSDSQPFSRLLTTAMLPKLASIHKRAALVFIIATNHVGEFDLAIRRQGRFDRVIQIMPPTYEAKMGKTDWGPERNLSLKARLDELKVDITEEIKAQIADLTYDECETFVIELSKPHTPQSAITTLGAMWNQCTLQTAVSQGAERITWADQCRAEAQLSH